MTAFVLKLLKDDIILLCRMTAVGVKKTFNNILYCFEIMVITMFLTLLRNNLPVSDLGK